MNFANKSGCENCNYRSNKNQKKLEIINPFGGGTALAAIYAMDDLDCYETSIMVFIGAKTDLKDPENVIAPTIRKREIQKATKIGRTKMTQCLTDLVTKNYLYIENNFDEFNSQQESTYYLSEYLFNKYADMMHSKVDGRGAVIRQGGGRNTACYNTSVATRSDWIPDESERSEENINEKNQIDFKIGGSQAEGEGLSLHQLDAQEEKNLISPMANEPPPVEIDFDFDSVQNQFAKRIGNAKTDELPAKEYKLVTDMHKKMIAIFRPTDPQLKKQCFVKDNDIHFFTDQILIKYGELSHNVIDMLFTDMVKAGKCGQIAWDVNKAYQRLEIAYQRWLKLEKKNE